MIFSLSPPVPVHQSSPLVQSSDCRQPSLDLTSDLLCIIFPSNTDGALIAGVTGNPIRAYYDPGGSDPLAELICRIGFASGSDPPPDQFYLQIRSFAVKTIRLWYK